MRPLSFDLHTEFAMWRQVLQTTREFYATGFLPVEEFKRRLSCMGFLPHEISAELAVMDNEKLEVELSRDIKP